MSAKVLDQENWRIEAQAVIDDIKSHVKCINISEKLCCTDQAIYLNLTTTEDANYCVELSALGFQIVGREFDMKNVENEEYYETPYSLLNTISPKFGESFGNALLVKLTSLQQ